MSDRSEPAPTDGVPIEVDPPSQDELQAQGPTQLPLEIDHTLVLTYNNKQYPISIPGTDTLGDLKSTIWTLTSVLPPQQRLVGLVAGLLTKDDSATIDSLNLNKDHQPKSFSLAVIPPKANSVVSAVTAIQHKLSPQLQYVSDAVEGALRRAIQDVRNVRKLKEYSRKLKIDFISQPRPGKGLVVLDLDYCILDTGLWKEENFAAEHFVRPYLKQFLGAIAPYFDVIVWSQTSWRYLEQKVVELEMVGEHAPHGLNVTCVLDRTAMFSITEEREGKPFKHEVKAMQLIWNKFPGQYSEKNTIHLDDLGRNFALNPNNGLRVHAYKDALFNSATDKELVYAARYLLGLALVPDISKVNHKSWRKTTLPLPPDAADPLTTFTPSSPTLTQSAAPPVPTTTEPTGSVAVAASVASASEGQMVDPPAAEADSPPPEHQGGAPPPPPPAATEEETKEDDPMSG